jgi:hypothetical protein
LNLWNSLRAAVKEWTGRWRLTSFAGNSDGLRNFVAADLAARTLVVVQTSGGQGPPRPLRVAVVNAFRAVLRRAGRVNTRSGAFGERRQFVGASGEKAGRGSESRRMAHVGTLV